VDRGGEKGKEGGVSDAPATISPTAIIFQGSHRKKKKRKGKKSTLQVRRVPKLHSAKTGSDSGQSKGEKENRISFCSERRPKKGKKEQGGKKERRIRNDAYFPRNVRAGKPAKAVRSTYAHLGTAPVGGGRKKEEGARRQMPASPLREKRKKKEKEGSARRRAPNIINGRGRKRGGKKGLKRRGKKGRESTRRRNLSLLLFSRKRGTRQTFPILNHIPFPHPPQGRRPLKKGK